MKENFLSAIAFMLAGLSLFNYANAIVALFVGITIIYANILKSKAEKAREEREVSEKKLIEEKREKLKNEK